MFNFKKPDSHTLVLGGIGGLAVLASAGLALWLYATSTTHQKVAAENTEQQVVTGLAYPAEHARVLGLPSTEAAATAPSALQPMPKAWDSVMAQINPEQTAKPALDALETPKYVSNAEAGVPAQPGTPKIAIVIDDVGVHSVLSRKADEVLPPEVTFSFLPYGSVTMELAKKARKEGREVMIHLPMEPMPRLEEPPIDPGPDALYVDLDAAEIRKRTLKNLADLKDLSVGANNHMGSRFTSYEEGMKEVLKIVDAEGLFFMDSLTTNKSAVPAAAKTVAPNMPLLTRDVFLDHYITEEALTKALLKLEKEAIANGTAIAIGHPHNRTLRVLQDWLPTLPYKGIQLVPITHLLPKEARAATEHAFKASAPVLPTETQPLDVQPSEEQAHVQPTEQQQPDPTRKQPSNAGLY